MRTRTLLAIMVTGLLLVSLLLGVVALLLWQQYRRPAAAVQPAEVAAAAVEAVQDPPAAADAPPPPPGEDAAELAGEGSSVPLAQGPAFVYDYLPARTAASQATEQFSREADLLRQLKEISALDGVLMLPRPLHLVTAQCGAINAYYVPGQVHVVLCYEMIEYLVQLAVASGQGGAGKGAGADGYPLQFLLANLRFMLLHEVGHALVDQLELNVTGREEDAVDQLAATLMLTLAQTDDSSAEVAMDLDMAGRFFLTGAEQGGYGLADYADVHALGEQRYFNLMCMLYGADPMRYQGVITSGRLPKSRAMRCPQESRRIIRAWSRTLLPHIAPYHRSGEGAMASEEAASGA